MRTLLTFLLGKALSFVALAQLPPGLVSPPAQRPAAPAAPAAPVTSQPKAATTADVGDFLWKGKHYLDATATLVNADTVIIQSRAREAIRVPWASATFAVQGKLAGAHRQMVAEAQARAAAEPKKIPPKPIPGAEIMVVEVREVLTAGSVVARCVARPAAPASRGAGGIVGPPTYEAGSQVFFLKGIKNVTGLEKFRVQAKRDGVWENDGRTLPNWAFIERYADE